jgi:hypothetical protein
LQKKNEAYERVQEYKKTSDDPLQQYRRGVESGEVKRETSFEDFKKQKGITQDTKDTATKIAPPEAATPSATKTTTAYDKDEIKVKADMLKEQASDQLADQEAQQMIDDAKTSGALQDPGKEKQLSRLNEATTTNQNLATTPSSTIVPVVNNTNNIVSGGGGGGGGVSMGVRNEEPILMQVQYGKVRPV